MAQTCSSRPASRTIFLNRFVSSQAVFLERVVGRMDFHRSQRHNRAVDDKPDIVPVRRSLEPIPKAPSAFRYGKSFHALIIEYIRDWRENKLGGCETGERFGSCLPPSLSSIRRRED